MQYRYAKKLHNRDQVEVRIGEGFSPGYVLGDPIVTEKEVFVTVQVEGSGYYENIRHTDLK